MPPTITMKPSSLDTNAETNVHGTSSLMQKLLYFFKVRTTSSSLPLCLLLKRDLFFSPCSWFLLCNLSVSANSSAALASFAQTSCSIISILGFYSLSHGSETNLVWAQLIWGRKSLIPLDSYLVHCCDFQMYLQLFSHSQCLSDKIGYWSCSNLDQSSLATMI